MWFLILVPDMGKNENLVTGLEWEDPLHVNSLSQSEERRLTLLITKIAALVNMRRLVLRPYFQDYELVWHLPVFTSGVRCTWNKGVLYPHINAKSVL